MTSETQNNSSRAFADSGVLLRAVEMAISQLRWLKVDPGRLASQGTATSLEGLAQKLADTTGAITRVRKVNWDMLQQVSDAGSAVLLPTNDGWLVAGPRSWVLLSSAGEMRIRSHQKARVGLPPEGSEGVLLEVRLGLEALSHRFSGSKSPWARFRSLIRLEATDMWAVLIYALVLGGLSLAVPVAVQVLVNTIALGALFQPLVVLSFILLSVLVVTGGVTLSQWYAVELLQRRLFVRVAEDMTRRLTDYDGHVRDHYDTRELSNRFFEVVNLQKAFSRLLLDGLSVALQMAVSMLLLAFYHPYLFVFDVVLIGALFAVIWSGRGAVPTAVAESEAKYRVAGWLESVADKPAPFGWKQGSLFAAVKADALIRDYLSARRKHYRFVFRQLAGGVGIQIFALVVLLGLGGWLVMQGQLTLGQLVAAELVVGAMGSGIMKAGKYFESTYDLLAGVDKLGKVVDLYEGHHGHSHTGHLERPAVKVIDLSITRDSHSVFQRLNFELPSGARVQLQGDDGSGKTTLLETLAGLRHPDEGVVRLDSQEFQGENISQLRQTAYLVRSNDVACGTVFENLRLGQVALSEEKAWQALEKLRLRDVIATLPEGLHTPLLGHGAPLSSGQIARLCLARAWLASPSLLMLDHALDDLALGDAEFKAVLEIFLGKQAPWTVLLTSQDARVLTQCPSVLSLPEGVVS